MSEFWSGQRFYAAIDPASIQPDRPDLVDVHTTEAIRRMGAWRWPLLWRHRAAIRKALEAGLAVDFGGLAGPIGYGAVIVDMDGPLRSLDDVEGVPHTFFSSHTLEHLHDPLATLEDMNERLAPGGWMIHHTPSWHKEKHRPENWPHHHAAFCLRGTPAPPSVIRLDEVLGQWGRVYVKEDDRKSVLVMARKH